MKKTLLTSLILTSTIFANSIIYNLSEEARVQNYVQIDNKIKGIDLKIEEETA